MKKTIALFGLFFALTFLVATPKADAQEGAWGTQAGMWEVNFVGSFGSHTLKEVDGSSEELVLGSTYLNADVGYLITDNVEVGVQLIYSADSTEDAGTTDDTSGLYPTLFASYNMNLGNNMTPYVGVSVGTGSYTNEDSDTTDSTYLGGFVGVKYFISEYAALTGEVTYELTTYKGDALSKDWEGSQIRLNFGLSIFLG